MPFYDFRLLSPAQQLHHALTQGQYLSQRWEGEFQGLNRYPCADGGRGFFGEVGVAEGAGGLGVRWGCRATRLLEAHVLGVGLPE